LKLKEEEQINCLSWLSRGLGRRGEGGVTKHYGSSGKTVVRKLEIVKPVKNLRNE
jgi:hypothetical protein